ncbi:MAG: hypothetical protein OHK0057_33190 [Thermoflexibacter sp.]
MFFTDKYTQKNKDKMSILNPLGIFEVLSKSTKNIDKNEKLEEYKEIDSLQEYVIIDQYKPQVIVHKRINENRWEQVYISSLADSIYLESIELQLPLEAIYEGVNFEG